MKLEQELYESSEKIGNNFMERDLEYLSASALYSGCSINVTVGGSGGGLFDKEKYSCGSGTLKSDFPGYDFSKPFGSKPLKFPKIEFPTPLPKVPSGPIRVGGSKPIKPAKIDFPKLAQNYLKTIEIPKIGSKPLQKPLEFPDGTHLTSTLGTIKVNDSKTNYPLTRLDFADNHKPFNHIQYGGKPGFDPDRKEKEADDLFSYIILKKFGIDL